MDQMQLLVTALGVAALAGMNLYLTVFLIGLSLKVGWVSLLPEFAQLEVLSHPVVLVVAGVLSAAEFVADKSPWFDSLWDAVHTVIRPVGAAFLSLAMLGHLHPVSAVVAVLLCGGVAMTTHLTKAGVRLFVNSSPEPFSNPVVSLVENAVVVGGLWLIYEYPYAAFSLLLLFFVLLFWLGPKLFRFLVMTLRLIFCKLRSVGGGERVLDELPKSMSLDARRRLDKKLPEGVGIRWAVPVITGKARPIPSNCRAYLVAPERIVEGADLCVVSARHGVAWISADGIREMHLNEQMLYDEIGFYARGTGRGVEVRFPKHQRAYFLTLAQRYGAMVDKDAILQPDEKAGQEA